MASSAPSDLLARVRRDVERSILRSRNGLKLLSGVGRPQVGSTPKDVVWKSGKVELWRYRSRARTIRPPLLLVHSLVSRNYVFDLAPGNSFVEAMLHRGFDVYLIEWGAPDELEAHYTLETYCDGFLPDMVDDIRLASRSDTVTMFGYCFGGLLALLYAAGHSDGPLANLAVMATPIDFRPLGAMTSVFRAGGANPYDLIDATGNVPAEAILNSFKMLQPTGSVTNYVNLWEHLWNADYVEAHQIMTMWINDHIAFPGACMVQVAQLFARDNLLATGRVPLGGRIVDLGDIGIPFLNIVGEHDNIVPPASTGDLTAMVGARDAEELRLPTGHAGLIVGRTAHTKHIPAMADWLERHSERA
jgi:polyhydroxyalkanoate synthase subunit PhaC